MNTGCLKKLQKSEEQYIVVSLFSFVFPTRRVINAARIVLFKSTMKLNNFTSQLINSRLMFNDQ